ncbi:MAG: hypothetical protein V3U92_01285 [Cellulophaga sp.]
MNVKYHKWLQLRVTNNYFPKAIFSLFEVVPFFNTKKMFKNYEILIHKKGNMVSFYMGVDGSSTFNINTNLDGLDKLYFQLLNTDATFYNYTELPEKKEGQILFFKSDSEKENATLLQQKSYVSNNDTISFRTKIFNISIPDGDVNIEVKDADNKVVWQQTINDNKSKSYAINLVAQSVGVYALWINGKLEETFFCSESLEKNCIGVWLLDVSSFLNTEMSMLSFNLDFNARKTHWQYEITLGKSRKIEIQHMEIVGVQGETYEGPIEKQITEDQYVQVYTTASPEQLQYQLETTPLLQLNYTTDFLDRPQQLEIKLPNPASGQLGKYTNGPHQGEFYSTSLVYV